MNHFYRKAKDLRTGDFLNFDTVGITVNTITATSEDVRFRINGTTTINELFSFIAFPDDMLPVSLIKTELQSLK